MHTIYGRQANVRKDKGYGAMSASRRTTNTMSAIDNGDANFKRRVHSRFLSDQNLRLLEPRLLANVDEFLNLLTASPDVKAEQPDDGSWGSSVNVSELCNWLTFDVITDFCYGEGVGMLRSPSNRWFFGAIRAMSWRGMMVSKPAVSAIVASHHANTNNKVCHPAKALRAQDQPPIPSVCLPRHHQSRDLGDGTCQSQNPKGP